MSNDDWKELDVDALLNVIDMDAVSATMLENNIGVSPLGAAYLNNQRALYNGSCDLPLSIQHLSPHAKLDVTISLEPSLFRHVVDFLIHTCGVETPMERHARIESTKKHNHLLDQLADSLSATAQWWDLTTTTSQVCADVRLATQTVLETWSMTHIDTTNMPPPTASHLDAVVRSTTSSIDDIRAAMRQLPTTRHKLCSISVADLLNKPTTGTLSVLLPRHEGARAKLSSTCEPSLNEVLMLLGLRAVTSARIQYAPTTMNVTVKNHLTLKYVFAAGRLHTTEATTRMSQKQVKRLYHTSLEHDTYTEEHSALASCVRGHIQDLVRAQMCTSTCVAPVILIHYNRKLGFQVYWLRKKNAGRMSLVFQLDEHGRPYKARVYGAMFPAEIDALVAATERAVSTDPNLKHK